MRINTIATKNVEVNDALNEWVNKKANKLDRFLKESTEVQVKLSQQKATLNCAEITIHLDGTILRVEETGEDMYTCIDKAVDKVIRQIRKHRTKLDKRLRVDAFESQEDAVDEAPEQERTLVKTKRFTMKPMTTEDAIAQMELLGHSFFLFIDDETNGTYVVYKRDDGNYGLLQPENA